MVYRISALVTWLPIQINNMLNQHIAYSTILCPISPNDDYIVSGTALTLCQRLFDYVS